MFKFLCRRTPHSARPTNYDRFVESVGESMGNIHIRDLKDESGLALCGVRPLRDAGPITLLEYLEELHRENKPWAHCRNCGGEFERRYSA